MHLKTILVVYTNLANNTKTQSQNGLNSSYKMSLPFCSYKHFGIFLFWQIVFDFVLLWVVLTGVLIWILWMCWGSFLSLNSVFRGRQTHNTSTHFFTHILTHQPPIPNIPSPPASSSTPHPLVHWNVPVAMATPYSGILFSCQNWKEDQLVMM